MVTVDANKALLRLRTDAIGVTLRQRHQLDLLEEILVGDQDDAPEWWRALADRYDEFDSAAADRFRHIAAVLEETQLG